MSEFTNNNQIMDHNDPSCGNDQIQFNFSISQYVLSTKPTPIKYLLPWIANLQIALPASVIFNPPKWKKYKKIINSAG